MVASGVRFALYWLKPDGDWDSSPEQGFVRLPSYGQLPIDFEQQIGFTPDKVYLHVEGGGPADYFRFLGDFTIKQVPEPSSLVLLVAAALLGLPSRRFRSVFICGIAWRVAWSPMAASSSVRENSVSSNPLTSGSMTKSAG